MTTFEIVGSVVVSLGLLWIGLATLAIRIALKDDEYVDWDDMGPTWPEEHLSDISKVIDLEEKKKEQSDDLVADVLRILGNAGFKVHTEEGKK